MDADEFANRIWNKRKRTNRLKKEEKNSEITEKIVKSIYKIYNPSEYQPGGYGTRNEKIEVLHNLHESLHESLFETNDRMHETNDEFETEINDEDVSNLSKPLFNALNEEWKKLYRRNQSLTDIYQASIEAGERAYNRTREGRRHLIERRIAERAAAVADREEREERVREERRDARRARRREDEEIREMARIDNEQASSTPSSPIYMAQTPRASVSTTPPHSNTLVLD